MQPPAGALVVFGKEFSRQAFYGMLQRSDTEPIKLCFSSRDALNLLNQSAKKWGLLILDGAIPDALDTVRTLRRRIGPHIKIVLAFSGPRLEEIQGAIQAGADDVVTYPVSQATLERKLHRLLRVDKARLAKWQMRNARRKSIKR